VQISPEPFVKTLHILVVTRNRLSALIEALASIARLVKLGSNAIHVVVTIQDNSDFAVPLSVLNYFAKSVPIYYYKTERILPMSLNWDVGLRRVVSQKPDFIAVLADRRLVTANLINAVFSLENLQQPFLCFDHQDVWINAQRLMTRGHSGQLIKYERKALLDAIGSAQINWRYPMLFNCLIKTDFFQYLECRYGSMAEGASPDINFLVRMADIGIDHHFVFDSPCIVTNARHAATSNGTSILNKGTIHQSEHALLSGIEVFPDYMDNFVTANITGSLSRYWSHERILAILNPETFFRSSLLELSYPKSVEAFRVMRQSLIKFASEFSLDPSAHTAIQSIQHLPSNQQVYPIDSRNELSNSPDLKLLSQIESVLV
jgi:hypothetical protein